MIQASVGHRAMIGNSAFVTIGATIAVDTPSNKVDEIGFLLYNHKNDTKH